MPLLDKFSSVQIEADNRISPEDKAFCLTQQRAFDASGPALQRIAEAMEAAKAAPDIAAVSDQYSVPYIRTSSFTCQEADVYEAMSRRNTTFITWIVEYFAGKYKVKLDVEEVKSHLIPPRPADPDYPYMRRDPTAEEYLAYRAKLDAHKDAVAAWEQAVRHLPLRYEQIVDEIFLQMGGFSFEEKARSELLERVYNATHYQYDSTWTHTRAGEECFELKNALLRFPDGMVYQSYDKLQCSDDFRAILDAVAAFESDGTAPGTSYFGPFYMYDTSTTLLETPTLDKVDSVKIYKNGRADIRFRTPALAQEFVSQFLRSK